MTPTETVTETPSDTPTATASGTPTVTETPTATPTATPTPPLDHFDCYKVAAARAPLHQTPFPKFTPRKGVVVEDAFNNGTPTPADLHEVDVVKAADVCNPANVNGGDASAPAHATHLEAYGIRLTRTSPAQPRFAKGVYTIDNALLGTLKLKTSAIATVLEPSAMAVGTGGATPLGGTNVDHFKCYKVSVARAPARQTPYPKFTPTTLTVSDELRGSVRVDLTKPTKLCLPADQNGEERTAPADSAHLVCYAARLSRTPPAQAKFTPTPLSTDNEFGNEVLRAIKLDEVCVPSQRLD